MVVQEAILHSSLDETGCGSHPDGNLSSDATNAGRIALSSNDSDSLVGQHNTFTSGLIHAGNGAQSPRAGASSLQALDFSEEGSGESQS